MRESRASDLAAIREIYNQGIQDRIATLDEDPKTEDEIRSWYDEQHDERYQVLVAELAGRAIGWASLNRYSHRCAYRGVADLSVYVARDARGGGVGTALLRSLEERARRNEFHKILLFALAINDAGRRLYRKLGCREVGIFAEQGRLDGRFVDVIAMEKLLTRHPNASALREGLERETETRSRSACGSRAEIVSHAENIDPAVPKALQNPRS